MSPGAAHFGPPPPPPGAVLPPNLLPPGWTEHKAPDGMAYYYNAASGQSSWIRPTIQSSPLPPPPGMTTYPPTQQPLYPPGVTPPPQGMATPLGLAPAPIAPSSAEDSGKTKKGKKPKKEKAIKKTQVLESPWFIVETNLENTFFFNKETKVSIWVPTPELEIILAKMGQDATEKLEAERKSREAEEQERLQALKRPFESEPNGGQNNIDKRSKNDSSSEQVGTEMTEDDVAWQLAAMEEIEQDQDQHMASQNEYDEDEEEEDEDNSAIQERLRMLQGSSNAHAAANLEITPETIQEREMAFLDMMRERGVTQFDTADMAFRKVERDPRYRLIPETKDKTALFESFCVIRAREIREAREKEKQETQGEEDEDDEEEEEQEDEERTQKSKSKHSTLSSRDSESHSVSKTSNKPEDVYMRLVEDYTTKTSSWLDFMTKYRVDPRFLGLKPGSLRESLFRKYLSDLKKGIIQPPSKKSSSTSSDRDKRHSSSSSSSRSSKKYKATDAEIDEFMSLLKETKKDILYEHKNSSSVEWRKIKKLIDRDRRYDAVGSSTERELLFRKYADRVIQRRD
ncbi:transcription elongation regulator [Linnemannia zychae]|nr:transcription elongation regulator [Linnemannia zychae]